MIKSHLLPRFGVSSEISSNPTFNTEHKYFLDGNSMTCSKLYAIGYDKLAKLDLTEFSWLEVTRSRQMVEKIISDKKVTYGVNTGFGNFATVVIPDEQLQQLQVNLIVSHATGVGECLTVERARMLFALRLNVLAKGYSGISPSLVRDLLDRFNLGLVSQIPVKGTVGASGDLAPLSHLILGFLGQGNMWNPKTCQWEKAADVLEAFKLKPLVLGAKEGLALINGTQFIASLGSEAIVRARNVCRVADVIGALTLEALRGSPHAFEPEIHQARPHRGQIKTAKILTALLTSSESHIQSSHENCGKVQDSYTLRCMPQVHGISKDTTKFVKDLLEVELNSATDNPMVFYRSNKMLSCGNFHGEYPAKALDYLAIAIHELGSISERRMSRLVNSSLSELPAFLVKNGGLNSGFMIAHVTSAALVSENKTLCHPASVDSLETSAAKEDHVSMGGWAARKALQVIENVEYVLAIELIAACQGFEFLRPLKSTEALESVYSKVREFVKPYDEDRYMKPDIDAAHHLIKSGELWACVKPFLASNLF